MVRKLLSERPILVGGLGLAASLGLVGGLESIATDGTTLASLIAAGVGVWWWRRQSPVTKLPDLKPAMPVERETVETAIAALQPDLDVLQQELEALGSDSAEEIITALDSQRQALQQDLSRAQLKIAIAGYPRSGKSSLAHHLKPSTTSENDSHSTLTEIALTAETAHPELMQELLLNQDAVIYLITEDLTESALADLRLLTAAGQRVIVALNKQDNFLPEDREAIFEQIQSRLRSLPQAVTGVVIATAPKPIKVRTYDADGQMSERIEAGTVEVAPIVSTVDRWLETEVPHLVAQTVMRQVQQLRQDIQANLNQARHQKALPVVEQLQWTAAATAFASPVPSLDLLAAIAINGQLVMDLGRVYQQPLALDQAKTIASELAAIVVKLGIVEVSSQLLTTALKSHTATFVVGGSVQAFSAAYLTRLCGESLMAYFEERALSGQAEMALSADAISQKLQALLPRTQRMEFLQTLVVQGIQKLTPTSSPVLSSSEAPAVKLPQDPPKTITIQSETVQSETVPSGEPL
ncbi:DUF697 domain-containing protein [Oscillatoria sp. CS-180]|uniref:DUF697 domain-containing protein n=1 Tax=Oscillatoria sp. CS-180 TaxID=3021720 RepID=UPI00232B1B6D|nr:DUF697 domain-containing protein [Oscillatoria sp. CS-180]MDB9528547.1 DUF697 domain-containing protein [Oscillatoria sp. CS-180]